MLSNNRTFTVAQRDAEKFTVYAGDGVYLAAIAARGTADGESVNTLSFAGLSRAVSLAQSEAVRACHAARRAGVPAWIVRHPAGALA